MKKQIKNFLLITNITIFIFLFLTSCSKEKRLKGDTPVNTVIVMKSLLDAGNYESFNELFTDDRKGTISREQFNKFKDITTSGTDLKHYELLTFTNGEMLLVKLTQDKIEGEYKIEDIIQIPSEMKSLFD